ncbi:MAG TPA: alpha,alpha-trehalase TreF [Gemmatimonadaceae bacterium]|nr:alpha,alpha-trehalase TreF [Gemmatimonadaceae bacterium]
MGFPLLLGFAATACGVSAPSTANPVEAGLQRALAGRYDPAHDLGPLFQDVQLAGIFEDSKTFVDARPRSDPSAIASRYNAARGAAGFNLRSFVEQNFELPRVVGRDFQTDTTQTMEEHIRALWPVLTRSPDTTDTHSSLIPLPNPYVVPGGRFREVYYWDSYFTMFGLVESGRTDLVRDMLDNFAYLITTVGHIPNGNRTYYLGRSQPPYFAAMVGLYARATDTTRALRYLDALEAEHAFWMDGADRLRPGQAYRSVVMMPDGAVFNRYWDDLPGPRPEAYRPDYQVAQTLPESLRARFYRNARATAESGWDFSSRWMRDSSDLRTLETTDLIPVDLNSLMYNAERTIAALRAFRKQPGDSAVAAQFSRAAENRRRGLLAIAYDPVTEFFYDVRWKTWDRVTDRPTLAAAAPLYFGLATEDQGRRVARNLERHFLKPGGFVTTTIRTGQQWDAPNGWPPLEWLTIEGVRRYGGVGTAIADTARARWLALNRRTYKATGRMTEKYDVEDLTRRAGGGEYATQDGFGWTNGVALALSAQLRGAPRPPGSGSARTRLPRSTTRVKSTP